MNPLGRLPVINGNGRVVWQSHANPRMVKRAAGKAESINSWLI